MDIGLIHFVAFDSEVYYYYSNKVPSTFFGPQFLNWRISQITAERLTSFPNITTITWSRERPEVYISTDLRLLDQLPNALVFHDDCRLSSSVSSFLLWCHITACQFGSVRTSLTLFHYLQGQIQRQLNWLEADLIKVMSTPQNRNFLVNRKIFTFS